MTLEVVILFTFNLLLCCSLAACEGIEKNEREKRTVGLLFRSFVDTLESQRRPPPMVHSYQPPRLVRPAFQAQQAEPLNSELISPSKSTFNQKIQNLKPAATKAPDSEFIPPSMSPPVVSQAPSPIPQVMSSVQASKPDIASKIPSQIYYINSINSNFSSPEGKPFLSPLAAQILIFPSQRKPISANFPRIESQTSPAGGSQFTYEANIYFDPSPNIIQPPINHPQVMSCYPAKGLIDGFDVLCKGFQLNHLGLHNQRQELVKTNPSGFHSYHSVIITPINGYRSSNDPTYIKDYNENQQVNNIESTKDNRIQKYF